MMARRSHTSITGRIYDRSRTDGDNVTIIRLASREESIYDGLLG